MNHTRKRNAPSAFHGQLALSDRSLVELILTLPMSPKVRDDVGALLKTIPAGKWGVLPKRTRDAYVAFAKQHDAMPRAAKKKRMKTVVESQDKYDVRETKGTLFAFMLRSKFVPSLGGEMPVPPGRIF